MKTKQNIKKYSFSQVFGGDLKSKKFRDEYKQELIRLRLAKEVRELRVAKGLTQKAVAKKAAMPQSVVARIESGKHSMSLDTLERIAGVFERKVSLVP